MKKINLTQKEIDEKYNDLVFAGVIKPKPKKYKETFWKAVGYFMATAILVIFLEAMFLYGMWFQAGIQAEQSRAFYSVMNSR